MPFNTEGPTCCTKLKESDIAVSGDKRIELKEQEKVDNYSELKQEKKKILNVSKIMANSVVIGALGVTSKRLKDWLKK